MLPTDVLLIIFFLFKFENVTDEKLLKIFVGIIDAKLLKTKILKIIRINIKIRIILKVLQPIDGEIFETENIQHTDRAGRRISSLPDSAI